MTKAQLAALAQHQAELLAMRQGVVDGADGADGAEEAGDDNDEYEILD